MATGSSFFSQCVALWTTYHVYYLSRLVGRLGGNRQVLASMSASHLELVRRLAFVFMCSRRNIKLCYTDRLRESMDQTPSHENIISSAGMVIPLR